MTDSNAEEDCKCGIRRSACEYHKPRFYTFKAATLTFREPGKRDVVFELEGNLYTQLVAAAKAIEDATSFVLGPDVKFKKACGHCGVLDDRHHILVPEAGVRRRCPNDPDQSEPNVPRHPGAP